MNDRQIECFLEAGRLLNFTRAAESLLLPQPAVSRYISALEKELGVPLFLRESTRKVVLTEAGKAYYNLFQRTALELSRAKQALSNTSPTLRLGINKSWSTSSFLPEVVARCRAFDPNFRITYECLGFKELSAALKENRLDAVLSFENYLADSSEFAIERVASVQRLIVYSDLLPDYEQLMTPTDFFRYDFLIADDPLIRRLVEESETTFQSYHFVPHFRTVPNQETVMFYVENGAGVALLDQWCYALYHPRLHNIHIDEHIPVAIAWRRNSSVSSVTLFRECLSECLQSRAQPTAAQ